ncbi:uncharacterized protein Bfra_000295 [Botrytis fragariae]|uniref:Uncharacterized protein n=1 Tax=Botrytis fragariae TaxID=1964551 RepID=A0A8H6B324_9HELO|nr:uncharacterized protein Bfra_000295 [Botrytis fragariae]KAF5878127.1 hypothetical protein Bfra_000295 [Botrytis fragariae]
MSQLGNKTYIPPSLFDADRGYSDQRVTTLHMACGNGFGNIAKASIEHGAEIELEVEVGDTNNFRVGLDERKTIFASKSKKSITNGSVYRKHRYAGAKLNHSNCYVTALCTASKCDRLEVRILKNLPVLMQYRQQA